MGQDLKGKVALIFGATSGIGKATALAYAERGASIVISGRREKEGAETAEQIQKLGVPTLFVQADVSSEDDVKNVLAQTEKKFGRLDFAFNNAGLEEATGTLTQDKTVEEYRKIFDTNVLGVLLNMKYEIPLMLKSGGGAIVNNASVAGMIGMGTAGIYVASKHAVIGLTKSTALEYAKQNIRVNTVSPAAIETDMYNRFISSSGNKEEVSEYMKSLHPVGRVGTPAEIASAVIFLNSAESGFITGTNLAVDGGFTAQ
jgi:NAD(P)-dependent dehydrogenase (short-subunit alcohol dehydrogenase family)